MKTVRFETPDALFSFIFEAVIEVLERHSTYDDAKELMDFLNLQNGDVVEMPQEKKPFHYAILDLLASNKGNVFCKACNKTYQANDLISFPVGARENPLEPNVGSQESLLKRIFGKTKRLPLFGGKDYKCPGGHELIGLVTWST